MLASLAHVSLFHEIYKYFQPRVLFNPVVPYHINVHRLAMYRRPIFMIEDLFIWCNGYSIVHNEQLRRLVNHHVVSLPLTILDRLSCIHILLSCSFRHALHDPLRKELAGSLPTSLESR